MGDDDILQGAVGRPVQANARRGEHKLRSHTLKFNPQLKYFVSFQHFAAGFGDGEHPKEPGDREDDRRGLRHLARRQPSLCASGNPYSGSTVFMESDNYGDVDL